MAGLTFDKLLELRKQFPEPSDSAFLLFCFIYYRTKSSKIKKNNRTIIYLTGGNDPIQHFGWSYSSYKRYKKELVDLGLIEVKRGRPGKPSIVAISYSKYQRLRGTKNEPTDGSNMVPQDGPDMTHRTDQIRTIGRTISEPTTDKEITKRDNLKGISAADASQTAPPAPLSSQKRHSKKTEVKAQSPQEAAVLEMLNFLTDSYNQRIDDPAGTMNAWMKFFGKYPADVLMEAAQEVASRNKFFPKPAELIPIVKRINDFRN